MPISISQSIYSQLYIISIIGTSKGYVVMTGIKSKKSLIDLNYNK